MFNKFIKLNEIWRVIPGEEKVDVITEKHSFPDTRLLPHNTRHQMTFAFLSVNLSH